MPLFKGWCLAGRPRVEQRSTAADSVHRLFSVPKFETALMVAREDAVVADLSEVYIKMICWNLLYD